MTQRYRNYKYEHNYTPMIIYILCVQAENFLLVCDTNKTPLMSSKPFASGCDLLLYDTLLKYSKVESKPKFADIFPVIHAYCKQKELEYNCKPSNDEIKLLLATSIMAKFRLDEFNMSLLDLLEDFDDKLIDNMIVLCKYDIDTIQTSVKKQVLQHTFDDYIINKSYGFISLARITYVHEITLSQVKNERWHYKEHCHFELTLRKPLELPCMLFQNIFRSTKNQYKDYCISFEDIMYMDIDYKQVTKYIEDEENKETTIYAIYSITEILEAVKKDINACFAFIKSKHTVYALLKANTNLRKLHSLVSAFRKKTLKIHNVSARGVIIYEFYEMLNYEVDHKNIEIWKKDALVIIRGIIDIERFVKAWTKFYANGNYRV